ncbi:hypothetical protein [Pseudarthrobacter sp. N5]
MIELSLGQTGGIHDHLPLDRQLPADLPDEDSIEGANQSRIQAG